MINHADVLIDTVFIHQALSIHFAISWVILYFKNCLRSWEECMAMGASD